MADTGNNRIVLVDSSAAITNLATATANGVSAPVGIITDPFSEVYFTEPAAGLLYEIYAYGPVFQLSGTTTGACTVAAPCLINGSQVYRPGAMSTDGYGDIFFADGANGAGRFIAMSPTPSYAHLNDPFTYQETYPDAFAVDADENLYSFWANGGICAIATQTLSNAANFYSIYAKFAGTRNCGFSGDGGQANSAEIGKVVSQVAFDLAGNVYFSDTSNSRVRRIDIDTGIIRTVAGNGTVGNTGDGGLATAAELNQPMGVAVDSQGQVYITSLSSTTGTAEVIRKVGTTGALNFSSTKTGTTSTPLIVTVSNTGTIALSFVRETITGTNPGDFVIDNTTTSCNFSAGNVLYVGQSCQVGVAFKPSAVGSRTANLTLVDNTITGGSRVKLTGTAVAPANVKFISPTPSQSLTPNTSLTIQVSVTSKTSPAPSGTVQFSIDGMDVGTRVTLASGTASAAAGKLTAGTHTIRAAYSGDEYHHATNSNETITVSN